MAKITNRSRRNLRLLGEAAKQLREIHNTGLPQKYQPPRNAVQYQSGEDPFEFVIEASYIDRLYFDTLWNYIFEGDDVVPGIGWISTRDEAIAGHLMIGSEPLTTAAVPILLKLSNGLARLTEGPNRIRFDIELGRDNNEPIVTILDLFTVEPG